MAKLKSNDKLVMNPVPLVVLEVLQDVWNDDVKNLWHTLLHYITLN